MIVVAVGGSGWSAQLETTHKKSPKCRRKGEGRGMVVLMRGNTHENENNII